MTTYELLSHIQFPQNLFSAFKNDELTDLVYSKSLNRFSLRLASYKVIPFEIYNQIVSLFRNSFKCELDLVIDTEKNNIDHILLSDYVKVIVDQNQLQKSLVNANTLIEKNQIKFLAQNEGELDYFKQVIEVIQEGLLGYGLDCLCLCELVSESKPQITTMTSKRIVTQEKVELKPSYQKRKSLEDYTKVDISMLHDEMKEVYFTAQLFKIDSRETRNGRVMVTLYFSDFNDAIDVTLYVENMDECDYQINDWVEVYGDYLYDSFFKENKFKQKLIKLIEGPQKVVDDAQEKRIELHAHTKSSEMDGVCDVSDLVKQAYHFGHKAIAITDHSVVHSFPSAQRTAAQLNKMNPQKQIKVIYGVEMNMVEDEILMIRSNKPNFDLEDASYVIFDLETTGLSSRTDHIIEFGAVKVENHVIVDQTQFFIKPPVPIPDKITQITQITNQDVENAQSIEEAFPRIVKFIGDSVLVAHNGVFDMRFIQSAAQKLNHKPFENPLIDTLALAWGLLDTSRFALGNVARYYKIAYDQNVAHRADYDAMVLNQVFNHMLSKLLSMDIRTSDNLVEYQKTIASTDKMRSYHVNILAKNQKGIKDIYKLVSLSHTDHLLFKGKSAAKEEESNAEARLPRRVIEKNRENLLIGSACLNSYLFELAKTATQQELEEEMNFYDFIELQPLENYEPLLYKNQINSEEELIEILQNIFFTAHKLNKLVVATGDVHYISKQDKVFRDIYINASGIGGVRHPLYIYDKVQRKNQENPNQHFRTTQEMLEGYPYLSQEETRRIVIDNPLKINDMIEWIEPISSDLYTPEIEGSDTKLQEIVYENAHRIYGKDLPTIVSDRIVKELDSIINNGFGVIYYTSHLLVKQSLDDGYMVGSRGSVGSSLVATLANITEVNPLAPHYVCPSCQHSEFFTNNEYASGYDLPKKDCPVCHHQMIGEGQDIPFETFLGFEGDKVPDIDLNFSSDYQERAHALTKEIFGEDQVLRAGTIGTIAEKTAFGLVTNYFENIDVIDEKHRVFKDYLSNFAAGVKRSTGQHPGGIVVIPADKEITDFTPYQYPANNPEKAWKTTHFEYHDIENNLLKLDILGHVDPTAIKFLEDVSGLDVRKIPFDDPQTMSIFSSTDALLLDHRKARDANGAVGIPEFGTQFVRKMLDDTKPNKFSDLVRISGLSHGTDVWLKNAQSIIQSGYTLDDVIACRDDIMTNLSHMGLDDKMAFNIMESVRKGKGLKPEWIDAMVEHGVQDWYIQSAQMIKYLFPKAHAVAYCMMGFRVAWFKVHRPLDFYAQYFTLRAKALEVPTMLGGLPAIEKRLNNILSRRNASDPKDRPSTKEENLVETLEVAYEMYLRGYHFMPLDIYTSKANQYWPDAKDKKGLMIPFTSVDGVFEQHALNIVNERDNKEFLSIEDFKKRTQISQTGLSELKSLNCLDHLSESNQLSLF